MSIGGAQCHRRRSSQWEAAIPMGGALANRRQSCRRRHIHIVGNYARSRQACMQEAVIPVGGGMFVEPPMPIGGNLTRG